MWIIWVTKKILFVQLWHLTIIWNLQCEKHSSPTPPPSPGAQQGPLEGSYGNGVEKEACWFVYIPAKWCALKIFIIFNLQRQMLLICCLISNAVIKSQNKIALKYVVILNLV